MTTPHRPRREVSLAGRAVAVRTSSDDHSAGEPRAPAVMVHGLGGQSTNWTDLMAELEGDLDAWAVDLPGFGWSPPPIDGDYSIAADADVVCALIEQLHGEHGERVHVFGNSMGGAVSIVAVAARPELVASLTLISPALPDLRPRRDTLGVPLVAIPRIGTQIFERLRRVPPERQVEGMVALNYADAATFSDERRAEAVAEVRRRLTLPYAGEALSGAARSLLRSFMDPGPHGIWSAAGRVQAPTLVLYGGRDRLVDPRRSRRAARHLPHAQIITLPAVGHVAQMEDPALVARFVRPMVSANRVPST